MNAIAFDTHASVKELTAAGFSEAQPEAVTAIVRRSRELELNDAATKADVALLRADMATKDDTSGLRGSLADLRVSVKQDLSDFRADVLKWMFGAMGFQTLVVIGAVAGLYRLFK